MFYALQCSNDCVTNDCDTKVLHVYLTYSDCLIKKWSFESIFNGCYNGSWCDSYVGRMVT